MKLSTHKKRCLSYVIDFTCILFVSISFMQCLSIFLKNMDFINQSSEHLKEVLNNYSTFILYPSVFVSYFSLNYYCFQGQTIGKKFLNIEMKEPKQEFTLLFCFSRGFLQLVSYLMLNIPNFISFYTKDNKSIIDMILKTSHQEKQESNFKLLEFKQEDDFSQAA